MAQEAKNVDSIFELVQGHKADTGIMLRLHGLTIEKGSYFLAYQIDAID